MRWGLRDRSDCGKFGIPLEISVYLIMAAVWPCNRPPIRTIQIIVIRTESVAVYLSKPSRSDLINITVLTEHGSNIKYPAVTDKWVAQFSRVFIKGRRTTKGWPYNQFTLGFLPHRCFIFGSTKNHDINKEPSNWLLFKFISNCIVRWITLLFAGRE